jgi:hypothetical protein
MDGIQRPTARKHGRDPGIRKKDADRLTGVFPLGEEGMDTPLKIVEADAKRCRLFGEKEEIYYFVAMDELLLRQRKAWESGKETNGELTD